MSDKRATYTLGAIAATLALVLGLIVAVPASNVSINSSSLDMMGHAVVVLKDTDGYIKAYQQSDNIVVLNGADCAADAIFGIGTQADLCAGGTPSEFTDIRVGAGTQAEDINDVALGTDLGGVAVPNAGTGNLIGHSGAQDGGSGALKTIQGTFVLTQGATVAEVGLFDGPGATDDMFSRILLGTQISAGTDDTITITYIIEVG